MCHKKGQYFAEFLGHPEKRPCNSLYYKGLQMVRLKDFLVFKGLRLNKAEFVGGNLNLSERLPCF